MNEESRKRALELLRNLVEIRSESGKEDEIKKFVSSFLTQFMEVFEDDYFVSGRGGFVISTHLDTVGFKREFEFDGVYAYGSGVCDAKGSVTAILLAIEEIYKSGDEIKFNPVFFCGEEEGGEGSRRFADVFSFDEAVVMEPTDLRIASHHYGSLDLRVEVRGISAHGSTPEFGVNAIEKSCEVVRKIREKGFDATILKIEGGSDEYVVPDACRVLIDVRYPAGIGLEEVRERLKFLSEYGKYEISDAYEGLKSEKVAAKLEKAIESCGVEVAHTHMPSWTDALNLGRKADVVVWGPGELHLCHTERERIKIDDILRAKNVIVKMNELL